VRGAYKLRIQSRVRVWRACTPPFRQFMLVLCLIFFSTPSPAHGGVGQPGIQDQAKPANVPPSTVPRVSISSLPLPTGRFPRVLLLEKLPQQPANQQPVTQQPSKSPMNLFDKPPDQQPVKPAPPTPQPQSPAPPAGQSATPAPHQGEEKPEARQDSGIALNLENADLYQVLRIIGSELKINYIVDPAVKGTVNINTTVTVSRNDLFSLLQTILQINGAMIVKGEGYYRVVPIAAAKQEALPLQQAKGPGAPLNPEAGLSLVVFPMHFMPAADMSKILSPFLSTAGQIVVQEQGNLLLVAETTAKLKQFKDLFDVLDSPVFNRQRVRLFPVTNNLVKNLIPELQSVFAGYGLSSSTSAIRFVPLERMNAILAISPSPDVFSEVEAWVQRLDQPSQQVGIRNFVYDVQNAKASDLRDILVELYGGQIGKGQSGSAPPQTSYSAPQTTVPPAPQTGGPSGTAEGQTVMRVQGEIRIISNDKNNALIIQATPHDYQVLEQTIRELDVLPRQVLIDAKIYEVDLSGALSGGISAFLDLKSNLSNPLTTTASISSGGTLSVSTFNILSNTKAIQEFLTANENRNRVKTLSAPSILVTDNTSARIQVGSQVPVPTGSSLTPVQSGGNSLFAQTIQYLDTGVILAITPRVNASGIVNLNITQEVSSAVPNTTSQIVAPVVNKTAFQTSVILMDGQPLALGGIIETSETYSTNRVPFLGSIPGLGALFGSTSKNTSRKELVLLLTPHVAQDVQQAASATQELLERMRQVKKLMEKDEKK
jgi:general secretion pathway protein D